MQPLPFLVNDQIQEGMKSKEKKRKLQKLFDELRVNLSFYKEGEFEGKIGCPICLNLFDFTDLSLAHIIPNALGGNNFTLTCKKCNSLVGSKIERYETERAKFNSAFSGKGETTWRVELFPKIGSSNSPNTGKIVADMSLVRNSDRVNLSLKIVPGCYCPKALDELKQSLESADALVNLKFQARAGWRRARLTYLHAAFLFLFSQFGYEWALDPCTQVIREQILQPEKNLLEVSIVELTDSKLIGSFAKDQPKITWYLITEPEESRGFLIVFSGLEHLYYPIGIWMPLFGYAYKALKVPNGRMILLPVMCDHLSTFNYMYQGNRTINRVFYDSNMI